MQAAPDSPPTVRTSQVVLLIYMWEENQSRRTTPTALCRSRHLCTSGSFATPNASASGLTTMSRGTGNTRAITSSDAQADVCGFRKVFELHSWFRLKSEADLLRGCFRPLATVVSLRGLRT